MISHRDFADLDWFFGPGISESERSTCGPMLERAEQFSIRPRSQGPITARPTCEVRDPGRAEPGLEYLIRYGRVSRRVKRVSELDAKAATVLSYYFGDSGAKWARSKYTRLGALIHMTATGQAMLAKEARKSRLRVVTVQAQVEGIVAAAEYESPVAKSLREAGELYEQASAVWARTAPVPVLRVVK